MIQKFVERYDERRDWLRGRIMALSRDTVDYATLVRLVVEAVTTTEYGEPDPERIHEINDGEYEGTLLYVIAANNSSPNKYWYTKVHYGSCSGCDTLQSVTDYGERDEALTDKQLDELMTLCLHILQGLRPMGEE